MSVARQDPIPLARAIRVVREFLDEHPDVGADARVAIARLLEERGREIGSPPAPLADLSKPSLLGVEPLRRLKAGEPLLGAGDVLGCYLYAYRACYGREDAEVGTARALAAGRGRALVLVRQAFGGKLEDAARYAVRAVRFWKLRQDDRKWPGPGDAVFARVCDDRLVACWRRGEIDRELGNA